jgi:hypothetical protein
MKLDALVPRKSQFKITTEQGELEFELRPYTVRDEAFVVRNWKTTQELENIFLNDFPELCRLVYHMLTFDSQMKLKEIEVRFLDENEDAQVVKGGPNKLCALINGDPIEQANIIKAIMECRGMSMPVLEALAAEEDAKKKVI